MRLQEFLGIYESGYDRAPWLPIDARITLELYRSVDYYIPLKIVNSQGLPVDLTGTGTTVTMSIKKRVADHAAIYLAAMTLTPGQVGRGTFYLAASVLDFVQSGSYLWEVMLTLDGLRSPVIPLSPCILQSSGTRYAC